MNDAERQQWVDNDEGLYDAQRRARQPKRTWLRENRAMIDAYVAKVTSGEKRAHWGKYG